MKIGDLIGERLHIVGHGVKAGDLVTEYGALLLNGHTQRIHPHCIATWVRSFCHKELRGKT